MVQYVGIMINQSLYKSIPRGKTGYEMLDFYEEAGKEYGLTPCYFRLSDISTERNELQAYVKSENGYMIKEITLPRIIHNRTIYNSKHNQQKIEQLTKEGLTIFNGWNRYEKLSIHELLMEHHSIRPHLPCTVHADETNIKQLMEMFPSLIIKPNLGSIGRGIIKLDRTQDGWKMIYPQKKIKKPLMAIKFKSKLPAILLKLLRGKSYIVQQRLELATYRGNPFDFRISVQRGKRGQWQVTGIVGKVAATGKYVTNVAQGGQVYKLETLISAYPHLNAQQVTNHLIHFALKVVKHLSKQLLNLADVGLDVGITEQGFPVFIECNGRDLRYSFAAGDMHEQWRATYRNPIAYAKYLNQRI